MDTEIVYIGLGSNLDDPKQHVITAIDDIKKINFCDFIINSSLYKSAPMGPQDQPEYINAVTKIKCNISAINLLDELQDIEHKHRRVRGEKWGPRTLDLDLLLYGQDNIATNRLNVPHPGLYEREFVLYPLFEIEPEFILPTGIALKEQIIKLGKHDIVKLI